MSAVAVAPTTTARPGTVVALLALLQAATRGAPRDSFIHLNAACGASWIGAAGVFIPTHHVDDELLPTSLLALLERDRERPWTLRLATRTAAAQPAPLSLGILAVSARVPRRFENPRQPGSKHGREWIPDHAAQDAAIERMIAITPPSIGLRSWERVTAAWALSEPVDVSRQAGAAAALRALQQLATRVGGEAPENLLDVAVPLPAFAAESQREQDTTRVVSLAPSRTYTLDAIAAALSAARGSR